MTRKELNHNHTYFLTRRGKKPLQSQRAIYITCMCKDRVDFVVQVSKLLANIYSYIFVAHSD